MARSRGMPVSARSRPSSESPSERPVSTTATPNTTARTARTSSSRITVQPLRPATRNVRMVSRTTAGPVELRLGRRTFAPHELVVMAIVNRTPDSFYDRGATYAFDAALDRVDEVVAQGAA